jgi:transposase
MWKGVPVKIRDRLSPLKFNQGYQPVKNGYFLLNDHSKAKTLQKNLLKHQQYILYFLHHPKDPPDNNGSERAIRNLKVKQKISGQFKTDEGADCFAIPGFIIYTVIKSVKNVLNALMLTAKLGTE